MAVTFTDSIIDGYVWSLERPMYLRYSKDVDNSAVVVSIAITQGSYSKTLTLKYSGLIKEIEMNISSLVKAYFQHIDYEVDNGPLKNITNDADQYVTSRTQKVIVTITDDDGAINTTQFYIKNANGLFVSAQNEFGENNFTVGSESFDKTFNIPMYPANIGDRQVLNTPILSYGAIGVAYTNIKVTRRYLAGGTISFENFDPTIFGDDKIIAIPIGVGNGATSQTDGIKVFIEYSDAGGIVSTQTFTYYYIDKCDISRVKAVWFEGSYGGIDTLIFANNNDTINKASNKFTLQSGDKINLNIKNRANGSLISEYVDVYGNDFYTVLFLSEKVQIELDAGGIADILLTSKSHRIKQIDNSEMKQYTFAYEEVEQLKY